MINKLGYVGISPVSFRAEKVEAKQKAPAEVKPDTEIKGLEALALYNSAMIDIPVKEDSFDIPKILPVINAEEDIMKNGGEKIYSSDGKLHSIIRRDENTVTVFTPDENDENNFSLIQVFDKSNRLIKSQSSEEYEGNKFVTIREYEPETGENTGYTEYKNSELYYSGKTEHVENGIIESELMYPDKEYYVSINSNKDKTNTRIVLDEQKRIKEYNFIKDSDNETKTTEINFYNGTPYSIINSKTITIPKVCDIDFSEDEDLKPAEYYRKNDNLKDFEGKRTYYSNGEMETNCFISEGREVTAHFLPDGTCDKITFLNKEIAFDKDSQTIKEKFGDKTKITIYCESNLRKIRCEKQDSYKEAYFYENNKLQSYEEGIIKNNEEKYTKWFDFNENGMITWARQNEY